MRCFVVVAVATTIFATAVEAEPRDFRSNSLPVAEAGRALELRNLPLVFEPNRGQTADASRFLARGPGYRLSIQASETTVTLVARQSAFAAKSSKSLSPRSVRLRFVGANAAAAVKGDDLQPSRSNYFHGRSQISLLNIPNYGKVRVAELYPGVDLVYRGSGRELEFDLVARPGADPNQVRLTFDGAKVVADDLGSLRVSLGDATVTLLRPSVYQDVGGERHVVDGSYVVAQSGDIAIRVGSYDRARPLVIDPVISYASYLGGTGTDYGTAIAVDGSGSAYVTGYTVSTDFPTASYYDRTLGQTDAFVTKFNAAGTGVVYSTYLGGSTGIDRGVGIAVDSSGNAYITGTTSGNDFPTTSGAYQTGASGGGSFVAKLGPAGNTLVYSTYVLAASATGIALQSDGSALITGSATSAFQTTAGAYQRTSSNPSGTSPFALKLNPAGTAATYSTFVGGSGNGTAHGIAVDNNGAAYIGGSTLATDFPVLNALYANPSGGLDGFVTKIDATGSGLGYSTYLGGNLDDSVNAIAIDSAGNVYIGGETYSYDFPTTFNTLHDEKPGQGMSMSTQGTGFVSKLNAAGNYLVFSTFLGGEDCPSGCNGLGFPPYPPQTPGDAVYGIAVDATGHVYATGLARSVSFPLVNSPLSAHQYQYAQEDAAFVTKLSPMASTIVYSILVRSGNTETGASPMNAPFGSATGIAVDASGAAYVTGDTNSSGQFQPTAGAFQTTNGGGQGAIAVKLAGITSALTLTSSAPSVRYGTPITLTAVLSGAPSSGEVLFYDGSLYKGSAALNSGTALS